MGEVDGKAGGGATAGHGFDETWFASCYFGHGLMIELDLQWMILLMVGSVKIQLSGSALDLEEVLLHEDLLY